MHERIIDAAEHVFAEQGIDAPPIAIIRDLGIGNGTYYRHFPDNDALMSALYERLVDRLSAVVDSASREGNGWDALVTLFDDSIEVLVARPFSAAVMRRARALRPEHDPAARLRAPLAAILVRAQEEGRARADLRGTDLAAIPFMLAGWAAQFSPTERTAQLARLRSLLLSGITNQQDGPLPGSALNADEFRDVVHGAAEGRQDENG